MGMTLLAEAAAAETAKFYGIVNIDASTIVFTLINTLIIVLLYRFLLHKKVMQILDERNKKVNADIQAAADANAEAQQIKEEYTEKLRTSKEEAQQIVAAAVKKAGVRESEIIAAAEEEAAKIIAAVQADSKAFKVQPYQKGIGALQEFVPAPNP